jgi:hypothetical protein
MFSIDHGRAAAVDLRTQLPSDSADAVGHSIVFNIAEGAGEFVRVVSMLITLAAR